VDHAAQGDGAIDLEIEGRGEVADLALSVRNLIVQLRQNAWKMALDWSQWPAVEGIPGKVSGAWVLRGTRMPVSVIFENLEAGANIDDIMEWFQGLDRNQIKAVIEFAACRLDETPSSALSRWCWYCLTRELLFLIRPFLKKHMVETTAARRWDTPGNGELLKAAEAARLMCWS
jgi:uncharacterized protein (DUF433 family)